MPFILWGIIYQFSTNMRHQFCKILMGKQDAFITVLFVSSGQASKTAYNQCSSGKL